MHGIRKAKFESSKSSEREDAKERRNLKQFSQTRRSARVELGRVKDLFNDASPEAI